jgi:transcriptional regulator with XRE-family HTH domain
MKLDEYYQTLLNDPETETIRGDLQPFLSLANRILELRLRYGLSQSQFARRVGLRLTGITRFEAGLGNPTLREIQTIARHFNLHAADLLKED